MTRRQSWTHDVRAKIRAVRQLIDSQSGFPYTSCAPSSEVRYLEHLMGRLRQMREHLVGDRWHESKNLRWQSLRRDLAVAVHRTAIGKPRGRRRYLSLYQW